MSGIVIFFGGREFLLCRNSIPQLVSSGGALALPSSGLAYCGYGLMTPLEVHIENLSPVRRIGPKVRRFSVEVVAGVLACAAVFGGAVWWGMR